MPSIEAQLALEQTMITRGAENYAHANRNAETHGRGSDTAYARRLMQEFLQPLVERLEAFTTTTGPAARGKARGLLRRIPPDKAMYLALKQVFNSFTYEVQVVQTASKIGMMIEDEIRFARFQEMHGDHYDQIIAEFKRKGTKDYRFMHRSLTHIANQMKDNWIPWSGAERVDVGMRLIDIILTETDLVEKRVIRNKLKMDVHLAPTEAAQEWIKTHEAMASLMFPDKMPCVIPPDDWSGIDQGGYYSPQLRQATPMVKVSGPEQRRIIEANTLSEVTRALNTVQATPWDVNARVLAVVREVWAKNLGIGMPPSEKLVPSANPVNVPKKQMTEAQIEQFTDWKREASEVYIREKERASKCFQVSRIVQMATQYQEYDRFWYVWYADFRGRLYSATAGFSPQGPDLAKGLLRFANGKFLGSRGWYWLRVHGANRYGFDKSSYDERVQWVDERHTHFLAAADDPIAHREAWQDADKPWQFLAFIFEYAEAVRTAGGPGMYVSHLPIGLDGSCNGLQNFSAMLRDERGGAATNLTPSKSNKPADIYSEVASVCYAKLLALKGDPMADLWLAYCDKYGKGKIPRGLAKRPVMTLPYGATRQSCTKYIFAYIIDPKNGPLDHFPDGNFPAACWLTPHLWSSIGDVVVAARAGMEWLQKCAGAMSKIGKPIIWCTSDGFPVVQYNKVIQTTQIETQLAGRFQLRVGTITDKIDPNRQRSGVAPNFVHSQDAAHLRRTVRLARQYGIRDMALIHDDYGTYAADTDLFQKIIRVAFVLEYRDCDPLERFAQAQQRAGGKLPPLPCKGTLDLAQVIRSPFFFG